MKTVLITGISASGKSTLGKRLGDDLINTGIDNVKLLDGENIRSHINNLGKNYGYSNDERNKVALEIALKASEYNKNGDNCIISSICHLKNTREQMKEIIGIGNVIEILLDCPVSICAKRDYKNQYTKAFQGEYDNFIGVTEPYQKSDDVHLILHTGSYSIEDCSRKLLEFTLSFIRNVLLKAQ